MGEVEMSRNDPMQRAGARCGAPAEGRQKFAKQPSGCRATGVGRENSKINPMQFTRRGRAWEGVRTNLKINPMQSDHGARRKGFAKTWKSTPCNPAAAACGRGFAKT